MPGAATTLRYLAPSAVTRAEGGPTRLSLSTAGGAEANPRFFESKLAAPREAGLLLLSLSDVIETRFWNPYDPVAVMDPVVTSNDGVLRFEGFSGCCGGYARVDFLPDAFQDAVPGRGTTNVDFHPAMRARLATLRDAEPARLAVGLDGVEVEAGGDAAFEKKVTLPPRWIKSFGEVQAHQPGLVEAARVKPQQAAAFLRGLPSSASAMKRPAFAHPVSGGGLRLSMREVPGAIPLHGPHRLASLKPLLPLAKGLVVSVDPANGTTAWRLDTRTARYTLLLTPDLYRAFSGEGQLLAGLAAAGGEPPRLAAVAAELHWQPRVDPAAVAARIGGTVAEVEAALAVLGARGKVGYDAAEAAYFHRELPFALEKAESQQPRLKAARALLAAGGVEERDPRPPWRVFAVDGTRVTHEVRLSEEEARCTCRWWVKHGGKRGRASTCWRRGWRPGRGEARDGGAARCRRRRRPWMCGGGAAPLSEKERGPLAERAWDRLRALKKRENAGRFPGERALLAADLAVLGTAGIKRTRSLALWLGPTIAREPTLLDEAVEAIAQVLRDRRPPWVSAWVAHRNHRRDLRDRADLLLRLGRTGLYEPERSAAGATLLLEVLRCEWGGTVPLIQETLFRKNASLFFEFDSRVFEGLDPTSGSAHAFASAFVELPTAGGMTRGELLDATLAGLARPLRPTTLTGFHRFLGVLEPTAAERADRADAYLSLLGHREAAVVGFALGEAKRLLEENAAEPGFLLSLLPAALAHDGKTMGKRALALAVTLARRAPALRPGVAAVLAEALTHPQQDVASAAASALLILGMTLQKVSRTSSPKPRPCTRGSSAC